MSIRTIVTTATIALVLTGCGSDDSAPPAETVPGLRVMLDHVDQAVVQKRYDRARKQLDDLVQTVELAHDNEIIDDAEAERLLAAAAALEAVLPKATPPPIESPAVTPAPTGSGHPRGGDKKKPGDKKHPGGNGSDR